MGQIAINNSNKLINTLSNPRIPGGNISEIVVPNTVTSGKHEENSNKLKARSHPVTIVVFMKNTTGKMPRN